MDDNYFKVNTTIMASAKLQIPKGENVSEKYLIEQGCDVQWLTEVGVIEPVVFRQVLVAPSVAEKSPVLESSGAKATPVGLFGADGVVPSTVPEDAPPEKPKKSK